MRTRIAKYRRADPDDRGDFAIGCRILTQPFFFDEPDWIPVPESWCFPGQRARQRIGIGEDAAADDHVARCVQLEQEQFAHLERPAVGHAGRLCPLVGCGRGQKMFGVELYAAVRHRPPDGEEDAELFGAAGAKPAEPRACHPTRGPLPWTTGTSYRRSAWYFFAPPHRYIIAPPLTKLRRTRRERGCDTGEARSAVPAAPRVGMG